MRPNSPAAAVPACSSRAFREAAEQRAGLRAAIQQGARKGEMFVLTSRSSTCRTSDRWRSWPCFTWRPPDGRCRRPRCSALVFDDEQNRRDFGYFVLGQVLAQIERWQARACRSGRSRSTRRSADFRSPAFVDRIVDAVDSGRDPARPALRRVYRGDAARSRRPGGARRDQLLKRVRNRHRLRRFRQRLRLAQHLRPIADRPCEDRSQLHRIDLRGRKDRVIVESVIDIAHRLGLKVVGEGGGGRGKRSGTDAARPSTAIRSRGFSSHPRFRAVGDPPSCEPAPPATGLPRHNDFVQGGGIGAEDIAPGRKFGIDRDLNRLSQAADGSLSMTCAR